MSETGGDDGHWHLDRKVPISIILALLLQGASGLWLLAEMRKDIDILKLQMTEQHARDQRQDDSFAAGITLLRSEIKAMSDKLDRLIERGSK